MAEEGGWTSEQLKVLIDEKVSEIQRAIDVAREGVPPHVTIQDYFEMLLNEREKAVQIALTAADKLEQERLARAADLTACERRIQELSQQLSATAILKAENSQAKQFDEFAKTIKDQLSDLRTHVQGLTQRMDKLI